MAKVFIGIALALMLATAALSFLAKGNVDKLQSTLTETKGSRDAAESRASAAQREVKKAAEERDAATTKAEDAVKIAEAKTKEAEDAKRSADELKVLNDSNAAKIAQMEKDAANRPMTPAGVPVEDPRVAELTIQLQQSQAAVAEAKQVSESMAQRMKDNETKLAAAEQKERQRLQVSGRAGLQGRILAVNTGWNFVVLSVGDKQGVAVNAPLLVVRGSEPIARLRITSVEPATSIADLIPGSVRRGVTVQPGDTVIFEGRTAAMQPKPAVEAEATPTLPQ